MGNSTSAKDRLSPRQAGSDSDSKHQTDYDAPPARTLSWSKESSTDDKPTKKSPRPVLSAVTALDRTETVDLVNDELQRNQMSPVHGSPVTTPLRPPSDSSPTFVITNELAAFPGAVEDPIPEPIRSNPGSRRSSMPQATQEGRGNSSAEPPMKPVVKMSTFEEKLMDEIMSEVEVIDISS
eukprot:GILJ01007519.1.p1 GENE.GILJ01007519.1~~GILJ01007519.1.p1  ORF type:complete len:181 (+),score=23.10 GILJ01007519.1:137-679(+)